MGMRKPKLRFQGYTDDWEQRKLGEIADKVSEKNKNNEFSEPFTNSAEQGIISQKEYFDREIVNNENLNGYYIVKNDDFIYNPRISVTAPVGPINRNRLGRNGVMSPLYTVFRTHDIDNLYLEFYFKTTKWHRFMKLNGDSGARFDRFTISSTQFMEMPIPYPTLDEQIKIGEYFDNLDHLITLHQRKCEETKKLKKYMLQKMFPKKGMTVPEIRFDGFTDDWEQRKLGSLLNETREKTKVENEDTLLSCAIDGMYLNSELFSHFRGSSNIGYLKVKKNDLILSAQNLHLGNCNVNLRFEHGIISPAYKVYEFVDCDPLFMQAWVKQDSTKKFFLKASTEGASVCRKNIVWDELYKQTLPIPKLKEQEKIGQYFNNLDHLITLHQRKCEELQKLKKFMLQNMFV